MKHYLFFVALIIILSGILTAAYSNTSIIEFDKSRIDQKENAQEISGFFNEKEKISVEFWPAEEWRNITLLYEPDIPGPAMFIYINITGPTADATTFEIALVRSQLGQNPMIYKITVKKVGDLIVETDALNQTAEIGGVTKVSGNYTALIDFIAPNTVLPQRLELYKGEPYKNYPYTNIFYVGIALIIIGVVLALFSKKMPKRNIRFRKSKFANTKK